ncbi:unnamed protein product [Prunus armeniaca]|uniref:BHLH domain-containing protein n=1 Tax=Prunus armeniaca TaxID=36596 RepID=A0A6J5WWJ8_PRUAR|nr:unnamed protein product [Prunus armeniaca]
MNSCIPDWNFEADLPLTNQKKPMGPDHELVELLWRNGQVVLHSQTHRKPSPNPPNEARQVQKQDQQTIRVGGLYGNSSNLTQDEDTEEKFAKFGASDTPHLVSTAPQPNVKSPAGKGDRGSSRGKIGGKESGNLTQGEVKECSVMTVGSSYVGSNQVLNDLDVSRASSNCDGTTGLSVGPFYDNVQKMMPQSETGKTDTLDPTPTSSSGGSGSSFGRGGKRSNVVNSNKRKGRDAEDSECQSEAAGNKSAQRSGSSRRSRAAEVHNLSERRRRDRINEKMRALQELIPHSNKTDKASMLDEAIEYLKSLQMQLQVMWMGSGMAPMMFPGMQHYMPRMGMGMGVGMGMGPPALPSMHNPMHLPRVPLVDQCMNVAPATNQAVMCQAPVLNPVDYHNQMQNPVFQEQYARLMGFHHMQTMSQPMNMLRFGSQPMQQNQMTAPTGINSGHLGGGGTANDTLSGKMFLTLMLFSYNCHFDMLISEYACLSPPYGPLAYLTRLFQGGKSCCVEYISSSHGSHASPTSERDVRSSPTYMPMNNYCKSSNIPSLVCSFLN